MTVLIKTFNPNSLVFRKALFSYQNVLLSLGYTVRIIDLNNCSNSRDFIDILLANLVEAEGYIITLYDDLIFNKIRIPRVKVLEDYLQKSGAPFVRLDGRPPGSAENTVLLDSIVFGKITSAKYFFASILGCYSKELLEELKLNGVRTAWEIERFDFRKIERKFNFENSIAPVYRNNKYDNLVVKGYLDPIYALKHGVSMPLRVAAIKKLKKSIQNLYYDLTSFKI
jgi:hypothetical protein